MTVASVSASTPIAVMPTTVPMVAFSSTVLANGLLSDNTAGLSLTFVTAMVKSELATLPSLLVALTVITWLLAASKSSAPATVTTPLWASIANLPPALLVKA